MKAKNILTLFLLLIATHTYAQKNTDFPTDFLVDAQLLKPLVLAEIPDSYRSHGISSNPGSTTNKVMIQRMSNIDSEDVSILYFQVFNDPDESSDDAGVSIAQFESIDILESNLSILKEQSNSAYLIKDNYLIIVWSDKSEDSQEQIQEMVRYYQNRLGAKPYIPEMNED